MTQKCLWRGVLIIALSAVLAAPGRAEAGTLNNDIRIAKIGIVVGVAALVVIIVVVVHESRKKRTVTGCVVSGANGISVRDEKDNRVYALSGNTEDIKPNDRVTLQGKKEKPKGTNTPFAWEVNKETKDFGACQP